ncbi:MAG TPA: NAD(P)H-hydrate dehydratase, partial [Acidimicrobiales bacterium]
PAGETVTAPETVTSGLLRRWPLPMPDDSGDKHDRGTVLVVAGSVGVPGAALLTGTAALRAGAGRLMVATTRSTAVALGVALPEALVSGLPETGDGGIHPRALDEVMGMVGRAAAVVIGPGMTDADAVADLCAGVLDAVDRDGPILVLDAAAVTNLRQPVELWERVILTPNRGELAALDGDPASEDLEERVGRLASQLKAVVSVRGVVSSPDGRNWRHDGGTVGLATSGSGDVLAGVIGGLAARGAEPPQAAVWGVHVHGRAGERLTARLGGIGFLARELLDEIPAILTEIAS